MHHTNKYTQAIQGNRFPIFPYAFILGATKNQGHTLANTIVTQAVIVQGQRRI